MSKTSDADIFKHKIYRWYNTIIFSHQSTPITSVNDGLPLQDYQRCPTTSQISSLSVYWSSKSEILCDFIPSNAFYMSSFDKLDYYLTNQLQQPSTRIFQQLLNMIKNTSNILSYGYNI